MLTTNWKSKTSLCAQTDTFQREKTGDAWITARGWNSLIMWPPPWEKQRFQHRTKRVLSEVNKNTLAVRNSQLLLLIKCSRELKQILTVLGISNSNQSILYACFSDRAQCPVKGSPKVLLQLELLWRFSRQAEDHLMNGPQ